MVIDSDKSLFLDNSFTLRMIKIYYTHDNILFNGIKSSGHANNELIQ